jgi:HPt (histidine-containing phosphotransfer) domain-containing protein
MEYSRYTDLTYLKEISTGDPVIIKKTVDKFLETTPPILDQMDAHLQEEAHYELGRCAHKLKSSLAFMGIEELKTDILQVERITKAKDEVDKLPPLVARIRQVVEASYQELRGELERL